jgi:hypothetical protein
VLAARFAISLAMTPKSGDWLWGILPGWEQL